jgi:haloacetate dehalogenase
MTENKRHTICANGIGQYYMEVGEGAPVVLLHGVAETGYACRHQIPELARKYRVIAPDLRGYGETDKPATGYDKRNMANDLRELMWSLEISKIALVGHDRGARVATRFAKDHPEALDRLVVMDNVPTRIVARDVNPIMAKAYWFFIFNQILDLPGALITGRENLWLGDLFADWSYNPYSILGEAFDNYVKAYRRPGAVRGVLADCRVNAMSQAIPFSTTPRLETCNSKHRNGRWVRTVMGLGPSVRSSYRPRFFRRAVKGFTCRPGSTVRLCRMHRSPT